MNGMLKNAKRNCDIMHVAPFATISISNIVFKDAEPFGSAFLFSTKKVDLSARSCPNKFGRDARLMINFLPEFK